MKVINVLTIFILGFVNVYAQTDSVLIHGKQRPYIIEDKIETEHLCTIEITDAIHLDSIAKQKYLQRNAPKDTANRRVISCEMNSDAYMCTIPPIEGMKYVILDVLRHKHPNAKELMGDKNLVFAMSVDMEGVLCRVSLFSHHKQASDITRDCMKDLLKTLNLVYRFEKPAKYNMYKSVSYSFPIRPDDWEKLFDDKKNFDDK